MAVELAKVSLWLHTFTVGAPLSFLDHHLRCGDSLFGSQVRGGIDRASALGAPLFLHEPMTRAMRAAASMQVIEGLTDAEIAEAHRSKNIFDEVRDMTAPLDALLAIMHAFDWLDLRARDDTAALQAFLTGQYGDPVQLAMGATKPLQAEEGLRKFDAGALKKGHKSAQEIFDRFVEIFSKARELVTGERFLNWQVAFPGVWSNWNSAKLSGGFDAVIGNPPWDRMKLQQVEWFAARKREIAMAQRASDRKRMVAALESANDPLAKDFAKANERAKAAFRVARASGEYPLLSAGDLNIYSLFVERALQLATPEGIIGLLTPIGIGTDRTSSKFFSSVAQSNRVKAFIAFENRRGWLFSHVHHEDQPTVFVVAGARRVFKDFGFAVKLRKIPSADYIISHRMTGDACRRINPNTGTIPIFRSERDTEITAEIYYRLPVLTDRVAGKEIKAWPVRYVRMFDMTTRSQLFRTREELEELEHAYPVEARTWRSADGVWQRPSASARKRPAKSSAKPFWN